MEMKCYDQEEGNSFSYNNLPPEETVPPIFFFFEHTFSILEQGSHVRWQIEPIWFVMELLDDEQIVLRAFLQHIPHINIRMDGWNPMSRFWKQVHLMLDLYIDFCLPSFFFSIEPDVKGLSCISQIQLTLQKRDWRYLTKNNRQKHRICNAYFFSPLSKSVVRTFCVTALCFKLFFFVHFVANPQGPPLSSLSQKSLGIHRS